MSHRSGCHKTVSGQKDDCLRRGHGVHRLGEGTHAAVSPGLCSPFGMRAKKKGLLGCSQLQTELSQRLQKGIEDLSLPRKMEVSERSQS